MNYIDFSLDKAWYFSTQCRVTERVSSFHKMAAVFFYLNAFSLIIVFLLVCRTLNSFFVFISFPSVLRPTRWQQLWVQKQGLQSKVHMKSYMKRFIILHKVISFIIWREKIFGAEHLYYNLFCFRAEPTPAPSEHVLFQTCSVLDLFCFRPVLFQTCSVSDLFCFRAEPLLRHLPNMFCFKSVLF